MKKTFLLEHAGPYVVFGDFLYPTISSVVGDNYVARPTSSGSESLLGLLDPIPLTDIEQNDIFSKQSELQEYFQALALSTRSRLPMDPGTYQDRVDTLAFIIGNVFPLLAETGESETLTHRKIIEEIVGHKAEPEPIGEKLPSLLGAMEAKQIPPYLEQQPEQVIINLAFPDGIFPPSQCSLLAQALNYNAVYSADGYAYVLRTKPRQGSDRIHIHGQDFFWSRRHRLEWIEEVYLEMVLQTQVAGMRKKLAGLLKTQEQLSPEKNICHELVDKAEFTFRNLVVRWTGNKCYLTMKRDQFARQDYEFADKWHQRGAFEIGVGIYYSNGNLFFGESPVVKVDYKDVAFYSGSLGMFRQLCSPDKYEWQRFPKTADGAAQYIRTALDRFYNGFNPENVKAHVGRFGDGRTYRDICPIGNAITAKTLQEVRDKGFLPTNYNIQLKK